MADLARIKISDDEVAKFQGEIQSILEYVGQVNEMAAEAELKPMVGPVHNVFRDDVITNEPGAYTDTLVAAFPDRVDHYLKVQKILNPDGGN